MFAEPPSASPPTWAPLCHRADRAAPGGRAHSPISGDRDCPVADVQIDIAAIAGATQRAASTDVAARSLGARGQVAGDGDRPAAVGVDVNIAAGAIAAVFIDSALTVCIGVERQPAGGDRAAIVGGDVDVAARSIGSNVIECCWVRVTAVRVDIDRAGDVDLAPAERTSGRDRRVAAVTRRLRRDHRQIAADVDQPVAVGIDRSF